MALCGKCIRSGINVETTTAPHACPQCDSDLFVGFGRNEQLIRDLPIHGKRVGIYVDTRRYHCRSCNKTFYERLSAVDGKRMMTSRLVEWMGEQSVKRPFAHIAEEIGVNEMMVKNDCVGVNTSGDLSGRDRT
mgnify:CR=1 FL=1